jgi:hypothetical protein
MNTIPSTASPLRKLYFTRAAFSVSWVILVTLFSKTSLTVATILLIIYPACDVVATFFDTRANQTSPSKTPQYVNVAISVFRFDLLPFRGGFQFGTVHLNKILEFAS